MVQAKWNRQDLRLRAGATAASALLVLIALSCAPHIFKPSHPVAARDRLVGSALRDAGIEILAVRDYEGGALDNLLGSEAPLVLEYGCSSVTVIECRIAQDVGGTITIHLMPSPVDAYGILVAGGPDSQRSATLGLECADDGTTLGFYRGPYFVEVIAQGFADRLRLGHIVDRSIWLELPHDRAKPEPGPESLLPDQLGLAKEMIPGSLAVADGPLGLALLSSPAPGLADLLGRWDRVYSFQAIKAAPARRAVKGGMAVAQADTISQPQPFDYFVIEYGTFEAAYRGFTSIEAGLNRRAPGTVTESADTLTVREAGLPQHTIVLQGNFVSWSIPSK